METLRTTVRLEEALLARAKQEAHLRGSTVTALIEEGLRAVLASGGKPQPRRRVRLPVSRARGGLLPGVDLNDSSSLLDLMEGRQR
jgi:hypothetical protein